LQVFFVLFEPFVFFAPPGRQARGVYVVSSRRRVVVLARSATVATPQPRALQ